MHSNIIIYLRQFCVYQIARYKKVKVYIALLPDCQEDLSPKNVRMVFLLSTPETVISLYCLCIVSYYVHNTLSRLFVTDISHKYRYLTRYIR